MTDFQELEINELIKMMVEEDCKRYQMGECIVMVGTMPSGKKHLSISHPARYPTWNEISKARYELLPDDLNMAMYLPSKDDYVNVHSNCFHLFECTCYGGG